jgi:hypothetical protein
MLPALVWFQGISRRSAWAAYAGKPAAQSASIVANAARSILLLA